MLLFAILLTNFSHELDYYITLTFKMSKKSYPNIYIHCYIIDCHSRSLCNNEYFL